jgi:hypothetical protein
MYQPSVEEENTLKTKLKASPISLPSRFTECPSIFTQNLTQKESSLSLPMPGISVIFVPGYLCAHVILFQQSCQNVV